MTVISFSRPGAPAGRVNNQESRDLSANYNKQNRILTIEASNNSSLLHSSHVQDSINAGSTIAPQEPAFL